MSIRERLFPTFLTLHRLWRRWLTAGGKTLVIVMLCCIPGIVAEQTPLLQLFCATLVLLVAARLVGGCFRPRLEVALQAEPRAACGEEVPLRIRLSNGGRSCFDLALPLPEDSDRWQFLSAALPVTSLGPGESCTATLRLRPRRRGVFPWPAVNITSTFPLNLLRFHQPLALDGELVVTPSYRPLAGLTQRPAAHALCGAYVDGPRVGSSWEYVSSREYEPGLPVRRWDYGSWARLGRPVVREFQELEQSTAGVVVDTFVAGRGAEPDPQLEAALSLAAALIHELISQNWQVVLLATESRLQWRGDPSGARQEAALMEQLAAAEAVAPAGLQQLLRELEQLDLRSCAVFAVLARWDADRQRLLQALSSSGSTTAVLVAPSSPTAAVPPQVRVVTPPQIRAGNVQI